MNIDWSECCQAPCEVQGFGDSTQHAQGAVELEWDEGKKVIRFVAHVVLGNSGLLLSRCDERIAEV